MTTYLIICKDKKNSLKKRLANREAHLNYLYSFKDNLLLAGPILNKNKRPKGSLLILEFKKKEEVINFLKSDTYRKVGLFHEIKIELFKRVF